MPGGGCDTQTVLCRGAPAEVRAEVARRVGDLAPGSGFVFTQVHDIQPDAPAENILAMFRAVADSGRQESQFSEKPSRFLAARNSGSVRYRR